MSQGDEPSPFGNLSQMCWVHRAGALFPSLWQEFYLHHVPGLSWPLSSSYSHGWSAAGVQPATCMLAISLGHCGRPTWRSRACPVWGGCGDPASLYLAGQVLASHFPQVEATTMKALFSLPSIGSELRWGRITVHPLNPSN